jgi:hypothetical protein
MNKVIVMGKLFKEGSLKDTKTGGKCLGFRMMDPNKDRSKSFYIQCIAFNKTAEDIDKVCVNGDNIFAFGTLFMNQKDKTLSFTVFEFYKMYGSNPTEKVDTLPEPWASGEELRF